MGKGRQHIVRKVESTVVRVVAIDFASVPRKAGRNKEISLITMCWEKWISLKSDHDVLENKV
jgi:hypothetical protein